MKNPAKVVWNRLDRIIGPMTISVGFGKFGGDLIGYYFRQEFGIPEGLILGTVMFGILFVVWPLLERAYDSALGNLDE